MYFYLLLLRFYSSNENVLKWIHYSFDVILDCTGRTEAFAYDLLKPWTNAKYVTLSPPTLKNFDEHGLVGGMIKSGIDLLAANSSAILEGKTLRWAYFVPSSSALKNLSNLARDKKVKCRKTQNKTIIVSSLIFFFLLVTTSHR